MKKMRFGEDRAEAYPMQMEDIYYNLEVGHIPISY